ncbi:hypothetical protein HGA64_00890 [Candidatus Falkowbacteria bacterium]|nr:hypothetical protein [Candidatus Falkowbacteria bacterium]
MVGVLRSANIRLLKTNVSKHLLFEVLPLLPSIDAPTVNQLSNGDYAIETVIEKCRMLI